MCACRSGGSSCRRQCRACSLLQAVWPNGTVSIWINSLITAVFLAQDPTTGILVLCTAQAVVLIDPDAPPQPDVIPSPLLNPCSNGVPVHAVASRGFAFIACSTSDDQINVPISVVSLNLTCALGGGSMQLCAAEIILPEANCTANSLSFHPLWIDTTDINKNPGGGEELLITCIAAVWSFPLRGGATHASPVGVPRNAALLLATAARDSVSGALFAVTFDSDGGYTFVLVAPPGTTLLDVVSTPQCTISTGAVWFQPQRAFLLTCQWPTPTLLQVQFGNTGAPIQTLLIDHACSAVSSLVVDRNTGALIYACSYVWRSSRGQSITTLTQPSLACSPTAAQTLAQDALLLLCSTSASSPLLLLVGANSIPLPPIPTCSGIVALAARTDGTALNIVCTYSTTVPFDALWFVPDVALLVSSALAASLVVPGFGLTASSAAAMAFWSSVGLELVVWNISNAQSRFRPCDRDASSSSDRGAVFMLVGAQVFLVRAAPNATREEAFIPVADVDGGLLNSSNSASQVILIAPVEARAGLFTTDITVVGRLAVWAYPVNPQYGAAWVPLPDNSWTPSTPSPPVQQFAVPKCEYLLGMSIDAVRGELWLLCSTNILHVGLTLSTSGDTILSHTVLALWNQSAVPNRVQSLSSLAASFSSQLFPANWPVLAWPARDGVVVFLPISGELFTYPLGSLQCAMPVTVLAPPRNTSDGRTTSNALTLVYPSGAVVALSSNFGCPAGFTFTLGQCSACSPGSSLSGSLAFATGLLSPSCASCAAGFVSGSAGGSVCVACPASRFQASPADQFCTQCVPGRFSNSSGATACLECAAGTAVSSGGAQACTPCGPGSYQLQPGSSLCTACAKGSASNASGLSTECPLCPEGFSAASTGAHVCDPCAAGRYQSLAGSSLCAHRLPPRPHLHRGPGVRGVCGGLLHTHQQLGVRLLPRCRSAGSAV